MERYVQQWVEELLVTMRNTRSDFLGFGARIAISEPKVFQNTPTQWTNSFDTLTMTAQVHCTVSKSENAAHR